MYRILVADDEGIMREAIKRAISENFGSECEIEVAKNGREVIELANSFHPDISFVDIQMPGLSGIQAITEIRKKDEAMVIIIITAYDRFSYAQEAINLNVLEYITKPVNKKKISDICLKAMNEVDRRRERLSDDLKVRETLTAVLPMIEAAFVNKILQGDEPDTASEYLNMLGISDRYGYICVLEFGEDIEDGHIVNALGANVRMGNRYDEFRNTVKNFENCVVGPVMGNRIVMYMPWAEKSMPYEDRVDIITHIRNMVLRLEDNLDLVIRAGIGDVRRIGEANKSYKEAIEALRLSKNHIVHKDDVSASIKEDSEAFIQNDAAERYYRAGLGGDTAFLQTVAEELFDLTAGQGSLHETGVQLLGYVMSLEEKAKEAGSLGQEIHHGKYIDELYGAADESELRVWFIERSLEIGRLIGEKKKPVGTDAVVSEAKEYIKEHFSDELSLDETARRVNISPYYFSRIFKDTTGKSFIEYLTEYRISKAREYLTNPSYSIKEVCSKCGYSDPNYFSRIFKKYEGVTPTEYRK
ncbi:MAG: response regulator [Lachnospiraceae bacterium]|nr:response regulator [Lachnospiraceae bacterium]